MKFICLFSLLCSLTFQAFADEGEMNRAAPQEAADKAAQREHRRLELRSTLKQPREAQRQGDPRKQFSEQDRHALRQQVRQQQDAGK